MHKNRLVAYTIVHGADQSGSPLPHTKDNGYGYNMILRFRYALHQHLRLRIHVDSYVFQSYAEIEVWTPGGWQQILRLCGYEMAVWKKTATQLGVAQSCNASHLRFATAAEQGKVKAALADDVDALLAAAESVLNLPG
jgi:hypothetical protein